MVSVEIQVDENDINSSECHPRNLNSAAADPLMPSLSFLGREFRNGCYSTASGPREMGSMNGPLMNDSCSKPTSPIEERYEATISCSSSGNVAVFSCDTLQFDFKHSFLKGATRR